MGEQTGKAKKNVTKVMVVALLGQLKKNRPKLLVKMPEKRLAGIVRAVLAQLGARIEAANDGVVSVPGFGNFRVRQVEREKDGKKITVKQIGFKAVKPKAKKEKKSKT